MKRYVICARRTGEKKWSEWADTNDIMGIEKHVNRIREFGYEAKVFDPKIESFERNLARGHLLKTPVAIGQRVYAVIEDDEPRIEEWEVKSLYYDGKTWSAINEDGVFYVVGSRDCITTKPKAEKLLRELRGEE